MVIDTEILSLVNDVENNTAEKDNFSFLDKPTKLAMDNCATFHVCKDKNVFIGDIKESPNIRVKGVSGTSQASGIGKIKFTITDKEGRLKEILLENVIYLPESPKNLISISRWSRDQKDDCGIMSRGQYSIFLWEHDECQKLIHHRHNCPIPIMTVNEGDNPVDAFISGNEHSFIDCVPFFKEGPTLPDFMNTD